MDALESDSSEELEQEIEPLTLQEIKDFLSNPITWLSISSTSFAILLWATLTRKMGETDPSVLDQTYEECCKNTLMNYLSNGGLASLVQTIDYDTCAQLREHIQQTTYTCPVLWEGELTFQQLLTIVLSQPILKQLLAYTIVVYHKIITMSQNSETAMQILNNIRLLGGMYLQILRSLPEAGRTMDQEGIMAIMRTYANYETLGQHAQFIGIIFMFGWLVKICNVIQYSSECAVSVAQLLRTGTITLYTCLRDIVIPPPERPVYETVSMNLINIPRKILTKLQRDIANEIHQREQQEENEVMGEIGNLLEHTKIGGAITTPTRMLLQPKKIPENVDKFIIKTEESLVELFNLFQQVGKMSIINEKMGGRKHKRRKTVRQRHTKNKKNKTRKYVRHRKHK